MITLLLCLQLLLIAATRVAADNGTPPCPAATVGDIPTCTLADDSITKKSGAHAIKLARGDSPSDSVIFTNGKSASLRLMVTDTGVSATSSKVVLFASDKAADRYRVFHIQAGNVARTIWLSGNNKGGGSNCQINLAMDPARFAGSQQYVYEFEPVPANRCY